MLAVDAAIAAARRGATVLIGESGPGRALAVRTTENLGVPALERFAGLGDAPPMLALTVRRARVLCLATGPEAGTVVVARPAGLDPEAVQHLADPLAPSSCSRGLGGMHVSPGGSLHDAGVKLMKLAGLIPAALVAELAPGIGPRAQAAMAGLAFAPAADIHRYGDAAAQGLRVVAEARVPLAEAEDARLVAFRPSAGSPEHLAIVVGAPDPRRPVLARLHSSCLTGDVLGSLRCDCGDQLRGSIRALAGAGGGVLLYLAQEGRGIGLVNKLRAYGLQDQGCDTIEANERLGFEADERLYSPAAEMLALLGYGSVRLMTNNPDKIRALQRHGIEVVERVPHAFAANDHNRAYLETKAVRSGHHLPMAAGTGFAPA
jgi:GTP cyclohydrolase II